MTTALEGGEGSASRPGHSLSPGKTLYPLYRRQGGSQGRSGQVRKTSPPFTSKFVFKMNLTIGKGKGKGHPFTSTEALYRPYGPQGE